MTRLLLAGILGLAGCSTYEQRVAGHCQRIGEGPGTAYYHECIGRTEALDQRNREMWSGATMAGASLLAPAPQYYILPSRY